MMIAYQLLKVMALIASKNYVTGRERDFLFRGVGEIRFRTPISRRQGANQQVL
jgi:hypothetical protein